MDNDYTVYISGPISKIDKKSAEKAFNDAETMLQSKGKGTINPFSCVVEPDSLEGKEFWVECMRQSIKMLVDCDELYMLDGWQLSQGCILERMIAMSLDIPITYENPDPNYAKIYL